MHLPYFDEANLGGHFAKAVTLQCLRQDVCRLLSGANGFDLHPSFLNALSDVVISRVNMFAADHGRQYSYRVEWQTRRRSS